MASKSFEELRVYRLAEDLSDRIWQIVQGRRILERDTIGKQIIRSVDSVGANIAEGCGRGTYQENRRFVRIARGSLYETRHWLRRCYRRKLLAEAEIEELRLMLENLGPQLNSYLRSIGRTGTAPPCDPND